MCDEVVALLLSSIAFVDSDRREEQELEEGTTQIPHFERAPFVRRFLSFIWLFLF